MGPYALNKRISSYHTDSYFWSQDVESTIPEPSLLHIRKMWFLHNRVTGQVHNTGKNVVVRFKGISVSHQTRYPIYSQSLNTTGISLYFVKILPVVLHHDNGGKDLESLENYFWYLLTIVKHMIKKDYSMHVTVIC